MMALADLFNGSPGCDLTASDFASASLGCGTTSITPVSTGGEQGFAVAAENPYNDFSVEAPAIGRATAPPPSRPAAAGTPDPAHRLRPCTRPTRATTTDNDVEYATDGVSWTTFNVVGGAATDQAKMHQHLTTNLNAI